MAFDGVMMPPPVSEISRQLLDDIWDVLAVQLTAFNSSNVVAVTNSMYMPLDVGGKEYLKLCMQ
jgi:hypothetical protein